MEWIPFATAAAWPFTRSVSLHLASPCRTPPAQLRTGPVSRSPISRSTDSSPRNADMTMVSGRVAIARRAIWTVETRQIRA